MRVEKIANLDKIAMALKADSVRILAPVPGKGCVGIEVLIKNQHQVLRKFQSRRLKPVQKYQ